jgi:hypothetical protein
MAVAVPGYATETLTPAGIQHNMNGARGAENRAVIGSGIDVALSNSDPKTGGQQAALGSSKKAVKDPIVAGPDEANTSSNGNNGNGNGNEGEGQGNCDQGGGEKGNQNPHCAESPSD